MGQRVQSRWADCITFDGRTFEAIPYCIESRAARAIWVDLREADGTTGSTLCGA